MTRRITPVLAAAALLGLGSCQGLPGLRSEEPAPEAAAPAKPPERILRLGSHHHAISTRSEAAQRYFDQGLVLSFGFNHGGAIAAYEEALRQDPDCAMCYWGIAYAHGPNINAPMGPEAATAAWAALQEAQRRLPHASPVEREYIEALAKRYAPDPQPTDRSGLDAAYSEAMRGLHERHSEDLDAATLYAESVMDLHPWDYWLDDASPREGTLEAAATLEGVLAKDPWHPGANHFLVHVYEEFEPEKAEAAADRLVSIAPDAGHLVHMPAHIFWRVGRYQDAWRVNELATASDTAYLAWCRQLPFYAALYFNHNVHFAWAAASAEGRSDVALTTARRLTAGIRPDEIATFPPLEDFTTIPIVTLLRFGRFDSVLAEPKPPAEHRYATALWHYARGIAYARTKRPTEAEAEAAAYGAVAAEPALATTVWVEGPLSNRLAIGTHHLAGEIAAAKGDRGTAIAELEKSVAAQDKLAYTEPPPWYFPVRQSLGATLLEAGRAKDAEAVYREDLRRHPKNGWSLFGLARALGAQKKTSEARWAEQGFATAWQRADVKLTASRF